MAGRRAETGTNVKISNNYNNKLRDERGAVSLCKAFSPIEFLKVFFYYVYSNVITIINVSVGQEIIFHLRRLGGQQITLQDLS